MVAAALAAIAFLIGAAMDTWSVVVTTRRERGNGPSGIVLTPLVFYGIGLRIIWARIPSGIVGVALIVALTVIHLCCSLGVIAKIIVLVLGGHSARSDDNGTA